MVRNTHEIKNIMEIGSFKDDENYAKFEAADDFARGSEEREFMIWIYDNYKKQEWSFKKFSESTKGID